MDRFLPVIFCMAVSRRPPGHFPLTSEAARCPGHMAPSHLHNELLFWGLVTQEQCLSLVVWEEAPGRGDLQKDPAWAGPASTAACAPTGKRRSLQGGTGRLSHSSTPESALRLGRVLQLVEEAVWNQSGVRVPAPAYLTKGEYHFVPQPFLFLIKCIGRTLVNGIAGFKCAFLWHVVPHCAVPTT